MTIDELWYSVDLMEGGMSNAECRMVEFYRLNLIIKLVNKKQQLILIVGAASSRDICCRG